MRITRKTRRNFALPTENGIFELESEEEIETLLTELTYLELSELSLSSENVDLYALRQTGIADCYITEGFLHIELAKKGKRKPIDAVIEIPVNEVKIKIQVKGNNAIVLFDWTKKGNKPSYLELQFMSSWKPMGVSI